MAAWIASSWLEQDRSWSFDLTTHCPLRLSTMNWLSATLVEPAEQPDQQDDWDRDPDQPEQKTFTHCVLLVRLAHINVRWELRFQENDRAVKRGKRRITATGVACVPERAALGYPRDRSFESYRESNACRRNMFLVDARRQDGRRRAGVAIRPAVSAQNVAASPVIEFSARARPGSFAAAYVIGIPTDGLFGARVPIGSARPRWDTRP